MDKKQHTTRKNLVWFLTNRQIVIYLLMFAFLIALNVCNIITTLNFIKVQQAVQNGVIVENWKTFLLMGLAVSVITAVLDIYSSWFELTINIYLRINLFLKYRKMFQTLEKPVRLKMEFIARCFGIIATVMSVILNCYLAIKTSKLVSFSATTLIGSAAILILAIFFGMLRGIKRASIDEMNSVIQTKEADLTKFYTFSKNHMENALEVLKIEYSQRKKANTVTRILGNFPSIVKEIAVLLSVYGLVNTLAENVVYSNAYIVMTAYSVALVIASSISSIFEDIFSCIKIMRNKDIKKLDTFEKKEKLVLAQAKQTITSNPLSSAITIAKNFTADVKDVDIIRHYSVRTPMSIEFGKHILLIGSKGTGKSRFLQLIESLFEYHVMTYNDRTKVFDKFYDNFKSDIGWNYELIQELAKGLKLKRFIMPEQELKELTVESINTGDLHLFVALIMLYYAVSQPERARILILDELLANIDKENAEEILKFIVEKANSIGSTIIFVGHGQQSLLQPHCYKQWNMKVNGSCVDISEKVL